MKVNICLTQNSGFCFGVKRAADLIRELRAKDEHTIYTIGELIHNQTFVKRLEEQDILCVGQDDLPEKIKTNKNNIFVIRAHGIKKEINQMLDSHNIKCTDATCPYVKRIHTLVDEYSNKDTDVIIIGDRNHPEVEGIKSYAKGNVLIFSGPEEITEKQRENENPPKNGAILVAQTTFNHEKYVNCQNIIKKLYTNVKIFDTICNVTEKRQAETAELAQRSNVMIVIGGQKSSNSQKLFEISRERCKNSFFLQTASELPAQTILSLYQLRKAKADTDTFTVGITAGASTPDDIIEEVTIRMANLFEMNSDETTNVNEEATLPVEPVDEKPEISEDMSFAEMLDASFRTLRPGERVKGVITSVTPAEVHVDLGIKHTGIIPFSEITDDPIENLENIMKPGDAVEVVVVKFNDAEGTVALSKKRIDVDKNWQTLVDAADSGEVVSGKIIEVVRGGLIMLASGNRIFIPASQTTLPRSETLPDEKELSVFLGQKVKAKILDTNRQRKRAVGSVRLAVREERKRKEGLFWESAQVGQVFTGKVKSITQYGAFVDLGGVDGMIHKTELSWKRIKHPTEVVNIGDEVTVFIKGLDPERRRISLGYRTDDQNPWNLFVEEYKEGDVAQVRIVSLMPFGAFAEVVPGVDGLIHISQISDRKIAKPADILKIGDEVDVKITAINQQTQKISLSIRALLEPEDFADMSFAAESRVAEDLTPGTEDIDGESTVTAPPADEQATTETAAEKEAPDSAEPADEQIGEDAAEEGAPDSAEPADEQAEETAAEREAPDSAEPADEQAEETAADEAPDSAEPADEQAEETAAEKAENEDEAEKTESTETPEAPAAE